MIKVMIADDEKIAIDSLKYIIEKNFSDIEIVSTATSGRRAIEEVERNVPDLIFMDIRMPGINGLEAIKEIKSRHAQVVVIVLTAFDQFDFAKEAVNLGVMEYLLKPVNRAKIIETINRAVDIIKAGKEKREFELEMKEKMEYVMPILENGFIYSVIMFDDNSRVLQDYRRIFGIEENGGYMMTFEFGDEKKNGELENRIGCSVRSQYFYPYFRDSVNSLARCIIGPAMLNRIVVFVPAAGETNEFEDRLDAVNMAEILMKRLSGKIDCSLKIGIGRPCDSFELLSVSYEESLKALRYLQSSGVMHFMDIPTVGPNRTAFPEHKEKLLLRKVSLGDGPESMNALDYIFDWLTGEYPEEPLKLKNKLLEIIFLVNRMACEYDAAPGRAEIGLLEEMLSISDLSELRLWCRNRVEAVVVQMNQYRDYRIGGLAKKAREFIKANYSKQLTLEDVSREINISPQYLSRLFKEETGENFIDYLTAIRIKIAKSLLENSGLSIKEICYNIGYSDPNYFSRIFKKIAGVTPTEYKDEHTSASAG